MRLAPTRAAEEARAEAIAPARRGYYGLSPIKPSPWKAWIPAYLFVGGAAGASAALAAAAQLGGGAPRLVVRARGLAAAGVATSAVLLVADLGRPARFLNMLRVFRPTSPMNLGAWLLSASGAATFAAALFGRSALGDAAGAVAGALGPPLATYTAVLVSNSVVPAWYGCARTLPIAFAGSAAAGAASLLDLAPAGSPREERATAVFGTLGKILEIVGAAAIERDLASPAVKAALLDGRAGALWRAARALTAASLVLGLAKRRRAAAVLGVAGAVLLRFAIMRAGDASARDPRATFG